MGLCAEVLAIGPFSKSIVKYLEYPSEFYSNTKEGSRIIEHLFGIIEGSSLSREFAGYLGVTDVWNFNQHKLDPKKFNKESLLEFVSLYNEYKKDLEALFAFEQLGFEFHFLPNG